jgi:flagellar biosynthesis/type III secretory pathway protein FliH
MTAIIKSRGTGGGPPVRALRKADDAPQPSPAERERDVLRAQAVQLRGQMAALQAAVESHADELADAARKADAEGYARGLADAPKLEAERLAILRSGVEGAQTSVAASLSAIEGLAAQLARTCLEKLFGSAEPRADLVCDLIHARLARMQDAALVSIRVSADDFSGDTATARIRGLPALARTAIVIDPLLPSGSCRMTVRLGEIDIGLDQQWSSLRTVLDEWAHADMAGGG